MLTGDKLETAKSIGLSCNLLHDLKDIIVCDGLSNLKLFFNEE